VQIFAFLYVVEARGGGTLAIAGSHHLLNEGRPIRPSEFRKLLRAEPFFADLLVADTPAANSRHRADLLHRTGLVRNVQLQIVGEDRRSGRRLADGVARAARRQSQRHHRPRVMLTFRYQRSDLWQEVADAFAWS